MKTKIYTGLGPFVNIKPGRFIMGSPVGEPGRYNDEAQHEVVISKAFELGASPVTQREWVGMMGSNPSYRKDMDAPVDSVSWDDAREFIRKINAWQDVYTYRLPSEAEWEYAARAGTTGPYPFKLKDIDAHAWHYGNSNGRTHPVAQKKANPWGLYDMLGNVREWCQDVYADDYSSPASGSLRVMRGGSFSSLDAGFLRADNRNNLVSASRSAGIGFRLVRIIVVDKREKNRVRHLTKKMVPLRGKKCATCGGTEKLNRHHTVYTPENYVVLCFGCHVELHKKEGTWGHGPNIKTCYICGSEYAARHYKNHRTCSAGCAVEASRRGSVARWSK